MEIYILFVFVDLCMVTSCTDDETIVSESPASEIPDYSPVTNMASPLEWTLWTSVNSRLDISLRRFREFNDRILASWRMFPTDGASTAFDLYRTSGNTMGIKLSSEPIKNSTNYQDVEADHTVDNTHRLCYVSSNETLDAYIITARQASEGLPYLSIPLQSTVNVSPLLLYEANDASVGDLDGDGIYEIVLKRLARTSTTGGDEGSTMSEVKHTTSLGAYKLNGEFMWRVTSGPNIPMGDSTSFAVYDFDEDGKCEIALRTSKGTIFGDGTEIGDIDGDGKTDYRVPGENYTHDGPRFLSVIEGATGKELARTNYISSGASEDWGDNYYKRSSNYRVGLGNFSEANTSTLICRRVYDKTVLEAWDFGSGKLMKRWRFDTADDIHGLYVGQGNHSLSVGDVGDGRLDEVVHDARTIDRDGKGLSNSGFSHGDALHLGRFDPSRSGLQIWSCFETGTVGAVFRDAHTGEVIWKYDNSSGIGRTSVADIDLGSPGCGMRWFRNNVYSCTEVDLDCKLQPYNMAIWQSDSLNRQFLNESVIDTPVKNASNDKMFTIYRYDVTIVNGTKSNPCFYDDTTGDWCEKVITIIKGGTELCISSTQYPTEYKFLCSTSDHAYEMSAVNQNIGYDQPAQLGHYPGSDSIKK